MLSKLTQALILWLGLFSHAAGGGNFSTGDTAAVKFGVHEIVLTGDGSVANPFDTLVTVRFTPPSGPANAKTVWAFYDGDNTWRARVYPTETGEWVWSSTCDTDPGLTAQSGKFRCEASKLRGRLLVHAKNPRQWITEDGRWFLNLNDTAYFLLCSHDGNGKPIPEEDVRAYVKDATDRGITSFRSNIGNEAKPFNGGDHRWNDLFSDREFTRPDLNPLRVADRRLRWLLDAYPDVCVQFILFALGPYRTDEKVWPRITPVQRKRILRYFIARFGAYPQLFWLIVNDAHFGPIPYHPRPTDANQQVRTLTFPNRCAMVREVGAFFQKHDPWRHPISAGPARGAPFHFDGEEWATYVHLEASYDHSARRYEEYHALGKPVFLGEDRYEHDHPDSADPRDMRYFQRRMFWSWLLAGGSANYGGRWWVLHPYAQTGRRRAVKPRQPDAAYTAQLTGLDSVKAIRDFFEMRTIDLSDFVPDHALASDPDVTDAARFPKLMRRGRDEFLVYHPNAVADRRDAKVDPKRTARLRLDLKNAPGSFEVEWYRAVDGTAEKGEPIAGGRLLELLAPWPGHDVVLRLVGRTGGRKPNGVKLDIPGGRKALKNLFGSKKFLTLLPCLPRPPLSDESKGLR